MARLSMYGGIGSAVNPDFSGKEEQVTTSVPFTSISLSRRVGISLSNGLSAAVAILGPLLVG